ncbi:MAG: SWIM zinc finger family protein, partial [Oscillospiraceae bacterium]|nr:SWIM zinc finger family protein [Oscillospiraceae bacterium]
YLNGPQRLLNRLIIEITAFQKDGLEVHYDNAIDTLEKLYTLIKKSRQYINEKIECGDVSNDDTVLYEELGGNWKLSELEAIGKCKKNARLAQLSFWVSFDEARKEYIDTGAWCDLDSGEIYLTKNYRPLKSLKYVKAEDSIFGAADVPSMAIYPADGNTRVRWDGAGIRELTDGDFAQMRSLAVKSIAAEAKGIKNTLKNAMANPIVYKLTAFAKIGKTPEGTVMRDEAGGSVLLEDFPELEGTVERLEILPNAALFENGIALCGYWYSAEKRRLCAQPLCIIPNDENNLIRLLY